jgi:hypothetical protein
VEEGKRRRRGDICNSFNNKKESYLDYSISPCILSSQRRKGMKGRGGIQGAFKPSLYS